MPNTYNILRDTRDDRQFFFNMKKLMIFHVVIFYTLLLFYMDCRHGLRCYVLQLAKAIHSKVGVMIYIGGAEGVCI